MVEKNGMTVLSSHTTHGLSDEELASGDFTEAEMVGPVYCCP